MKNKDIKDLNLKAEIEKIIGEIKEEYKKAEETLDAFKEKKLTKQEVLDIVDINWINFDYEWLKVKEIHEDIVKAINDGWIYSHTEYKMLGNSTITSNLLFKKEKPYRIKSLEFLTINEIQKLLRQYDLEHNCAVIQALLKGEINNDTAIKLLQNNCDIPF